MTAITTRIGAACQEETHTGVTWCRPDLLSEGTFAACLRSIKFKGKTLKAVAAKLAKSIASKLEKQIKSLAEDIFLEEETEYQKILDDYVDKRATKCTL